MDLLSPEIYEPNRIITYQQIPAEIYSLQLFLVLVWCDPSRYYTSDTSQASETHRKAKAELDLVAISLEIYEHNTRSFMLPLSLPFSHPRSLKVILYKIGEETI